MAQLNVKFVGNNSWGRQFVRRAAGAGNKQPLWILLFDNQPPADVTGYTFAITSANFTWEEDATARHYTNLGSGFAVLTLAVNPVAKANPVPTATAQDAIAVTVTNTASGKSTTDKGPVEVVDEMLVSFLAELSLGGKAAPAALTPDSLG